MKTQPIVNKCFIHYAFCYSVTHVICLLFELLFSAINSCTKHQFESSVQGTLKLSLKAAAKTISFLCSVALNLDKGTSVFVVNFIMQERWKNIAQNVV
jgi:hypothetical protein